MQSGAPSPLHRSAVSIQHNNVRAVHSQGRIVLDVAAVVYELFFRYHCLIVLEIFIVGSHCEQDVHCRVGGGFAIAWFGRSLQDGIFANQSGFSGVSVGILVKRVKFTE